MVLNKMHPGVKTHISKQLDTTIVRKKFKMISIYRELKHHSLSGLDIQQRPRRQDSYLQAISGDYPGTSPPSTKKTPRQASYQKAVGTLSPEGSVIDFNKAKMEQRQPSYQKAVGTMSPDERYVIVVMYEP